jgi:hypothetical protein
MFREVFALGAECDNIFTWSVPVIASCSRDGGHDMSNGPFF